MAYHDMYNTVLKGVLQVPGSGAGASYNITMRWCQLLQRWAGVSSLVFLALCLGVVYAM
jgi:hypothetical protein